MLLEVYIKVLARNKHTAGSLRKLERDYLVAIILKVAKGLYLADPKPILGLV